MNQSHLNNNVDNTNNNQTMNTVDNKINQFDNTPEYKVQFSDIRFLSYPMPDQKECQSLGIPDDHARYVRLIDKIEDEKYGVLKLFHYLTPTALEPTGFYGKINSLDIDNLMDKEYSRFNRVSHIRGIVLNEDGDIVCRSLGFTPQYNIKDIMNDTQSLSNINNSNVFRACEGTIIRVFYLKDKWFYSTHKRLDAYNSFPSSSSKKSFGKLFDEIIQQKPFFDKLDHDKVYSFLMIHKENTICLSTTDMTPEFNRVYLTSVYNTKTNEFEEDIDKMLNGFEMNSVEEKLDTPQDLEKIMNKESMSVFNTGLIMYNKGKAKKVCHDEYLELLHLRGSNPAIEWRYLELRDSMDKQKQLRTMFPWGSIQCDKMDVKYQNLISKVHNLYMHKFITKDAYEMPKEEYVTICRLHEWFKNKRTQGDKNIRVSRDVVKEHLDKAPLMYIQRMMKRLKPKKH